MPLSCMVQERQLRLIHRQSTATLCMVRDMHGALVPSGMTIHSLQPTFASFQAWSLHSYIRTLLPRMLTGVEQLSRLDARFLAYQGSLFSPTTLTLDPNKLTKEELSNVNKSIESFLKLLSPHFLSPGSFKTIEYLIRRYRQASSEATFTILCS